MSINRGGKSGKKTGTPGFFLPQLLYRGKKTVIIDHNDNRNLVHPHGPLLEEVTVSTRNNFVSNVITYKSIIRIILINLGKTIPFTKSNYDNKEQLWELINSFFLVLSFHVSYKLAFLWKHFSHSAH